MLKSCDRNAILFTNGDNDTYPALYLQIVENFRPDIKVVNLSLLNTDYHIRHLRDTGPQTPMLITETDKDIVDLKLTQWKEQQVTIEVTNSSNGIDTLSWTIKPTYKNNLLRVQDLLIFKLIKNGYDYYPFYFAATVSPASKIGLDDYLQSEGMVSKLVSEKGTQVNVQKLHENLFQNYSYNTIWDEHVTNIPNLGGLLLNYRLMFLQLAAITYEELAAANQNNEDKSLQQDKYTELVEILEKMDEVLPESRVQTDSPKLLNMITQLYKIIEVERNLVGSNKKGQR